jgi:uncharacterized protein YbjT (DUF2867 family)
VILVTGANGFIGSHLVRVLVAGGAHVRALVRHVDKAKALEGLACERVEGDMTDADSLGAAVAGCSQVVHLAAIRQGRERDFERVMIQGTRDLVAAAAAAGADRFVLMSALGTSEETKDLVPYYRAKWEMERAVASSGLEHVTIRPSFVFARDGGILPTFRKLARVAPVTPIIGPGTQRIQPIWIDDIVSYLAAAVDRQGVANRTFEVGGPDVVSWNEFWARLKQALGLRRPSVHMPLWFMRLNALVTERLPGDVPLTRDLLKMLEGPDNIASDDTAPLAFGIDPLPLDEQLRLAVAKS